MDKSTQVRVLIEHRESGIFVMLLRERSNCSNIENTVISSGISRISHDCKLRSFRNLGNQNEENRKLGICGNDSLESFTVSKPGV